MKAVWLTQQQVDEAWHQILRSPDARLEIRANVGFSGLDRSNLWLALNNQIVKRKYKLVTLVFRRQQYKAGWQLITPVQIVDEWLARQMQTVDE